jgi:hypothetical protein
MKKWILATTWILALTFAALTLSSSALAQSKNDVTGTWKLLSFTSTTDKGEVKTLMGQRPIGFISYTPDGRMSVVITAEARKPLSVNDRIAAPADERAEPFSTVITYAGRYTFTGDKIVHHVEASWMPNQVGTDLVRSVKLEGDRLTLRTTPTLQAGVQTTTDLVWEHLK